MNKNMKIALFHPWLKSKGGGEKVVLELLKKSKHNIDVYTWFYDKKQTFDEFKNYKINVIAPRIAKKFSRSYLLRGLLFPLGILKKIPLEEYELFFISTSGLGEFITFKNYLPEKTIAYVHTPLRDANNQIIAWNLKNRYFNKKIRGALYLLATKIYRYFEKKAWKRLDFVIFNSELSKKRAEEHKLIANKKTTIINPPINLSSRKPNNKKSDYFIYISRINPPKRQDVLIRAWIEFIKNYPKMNLFIVGTSENQKYLRKLNVLSKNDKNIIIKTNVENDELKNLLHNSKAGLFLGYLEDFGITPLDIISANKPLLSVNEGGFVPLIQGHHLFHEIEEKHDNDLMVEEVKNALNRFMKTKNKAGNKKIKRGNFAKEIDEVISSLS